MVLAAPSSQKAAHGLPTRYRTRQLIVFDTLFAFGYGFLHMQRLPVPLELLAIVLLASGVVWALGRHRIPGSKDPIVAKPRT